MATTTELNNWFNGTPTGGPNGDGYYPLTNSDGVVVLTPCPALQAQPTSTDPVFGELAFKDQVDWNTDVINKPVIGGGGGSGTVTQVSVSNVTGISFTGGTPDANGLVTITPALSLNLQAWSAIDPVNKADAGHSHAASAITQDATHRFTNDTDINKLAGIATNANYYVHPESHPPTIIVEDASHRWFTDTERTKLSGVEAGANNYVHPGSHPASMITEDASRRFTNDADIAKLAGIEAGANNFTYEHPASHPASMITQDSDHRFVTDAEKATWNAGSSGGGMAWLSVNADTAMAVNIGYLVSGARTMTLPANAPVGMYSVHALTDTVIVESNSNLVRDIGAGEDLSLRKGEVVLFVCTSVGNLEIV